MNKSAMEILEKSPLSKPRMMGTQGEKDTVNFITNFLNNNSLTPQKESIQWSNGMVRARKVMNILTILFMGFFTYSLFFLPEPYNGYTPLVTVLVFIGFTFLFGKLILNMKFEFLGKKAKGDNIICKIYSKNYIPPNLQINAEKKEEKEALRDKIKEVYLTAHYDSIASSMPKFSKIRLVGMGISLLTILLLSITTGILNLITFYADTTVLSKTSLIMNWIVFGASSFAMFLTIIGFFSKRTNDSEGVCDNGSGSAILLELAAFFGKNPLDNINLTFIWCTAEEWGLYGSKAYVKAHNEELLNMKDRFFNINVDMVGEEIAYVAKKGILRKKPLNKTLNTLIKESAEEKEIKIRGFKAMVAGSSDHAPFAKIKLEVATFNSKKDVKKIHSKKDCIDIVKPENIAGTVEVIKTVIQKLDKKE